MKAHARKARHLDDDRPSMTPKHGINEVISFSDKDLEGIQDPHDDPLVLTITVSNF